MSTPSAPPRHRLVDALRGFALLGILVVNVEFIFQPGGLGWEEATGTADLAARWLLSAFAHLKFYLLFSVLFGYGLSVQLRRSSPGRRLGPRYARRMAGLIVLGVLHALLFFTGDILVLYGIIGALAYFTRNLPSRALLIGAAAVYGSAALLRVAVAVRNTLGGEVVAADTAPAETGVRASGSFWDVVHLNAGEWHHVFLDLSMLQGPAVLAAFWVGLVIGRSTIFSDPGSHARRLRGWLLRWGAVGLAGSAIGATMVVANGEDTFAYALGFALLFAVAPALTSAYVAAIALALGARPSNVARPAEAAGRMSLSVYLLQSVVAVTLADGYGVGLLGAIGPWGGIAIAIGIWAGLCLFAMSWMTRCRFGPFEWVLRSWTYLSLQPLLRPTSPPLPETRSAKIPA